MYVCIYVCMYVCLQDCLTMYAEFEYLEVVKVTDPDDGLAGSELEMYIEYTTGMYCIMYVCMYVRMYICMYVYHVCYSH